MKNRHKQASIGKDKAIELWDSKWWVGKTDYEIAKFQLFTEELSLPFDIFQNSMEKVLGRPIFTHEFGLNFDGLADELLTKNE